jgi:hypothetical protein
MMASPFPFQPLVPPKIYLNKRSSQTWEIIPQEERKYRYECWAQPHVVYEDWRQVDRENGDLLYVGAAAAKMLNRLHPTNHAMWSVVYKHRLYPRIRIAIWSMPAEDCYEIEAWFARNYCPLWSGAVQNPRREWLWRPPDFIQKPSVFDPFRRSKPPFAYENTGVYAWLLAPKTEDVGWVERVAVAGSPARQTKEKPHGPAFPFFCHNCGARSKKPIKLCAGCGKTEAEAFEIERHILDRLYEGPEPSGD